MSNPFEKTNRYLILPIKLCYYTTAFVLESCIMFMIIGLAIALILLAISSCELHKPTNEAHYMHYYEI